MSLASPYVYPRPLADYAKSLKRNSSDPHSILAQEFAANSPKMIKVPYVKKIAPTSQYLPLGMANPLDDILAYSRKQILSYEMKLPFGSNDHLEGPLDSSVESETRTPSDLRSPLSPCFDTKFSSEPSVRSTPVSPSSVDLTVPSFLQPPTDQFTYQPGYDGKLPETEVEDKDQDPLACHANNIVRMAMDTTMMGSFCNSSISLNFLNLVDESIHKLADGGERSRIGPKKGGFLNLLKATKVEISAADLEDAINNPIR